jgi:hypothetical protein
LNPFFLQNLDLEIFGTAMILLSMETLQVDHANPKLELIEGKKDGMLSKVLLLNFGTGYHSIFLPSNSTW